GILQGGNATLSVTATGAAPLNYSWYLNATNLVQNGTNASFMVSSMSVGDAGQYTVVVTNAYGSVTSRVAKHSGGLAFLSCLGAAFRVMDGRRERQHPAQPTAQNIKTGTERGQQHFSSFLSAGKAIHKHLVIMALQSGAPSRS
ncbi:MAG: immunoglobulin domain-containing protein, partial [Verrucomicrobiota bacterium]